jgi:2-dehydropantoate 2-reductase
VKAIINSSINPLTAILLCKNGYLLENPVLEYMMEKICTESTIVANAQDVTVTSSVMIRKTKQVIRETAENHSSMAQSIQHHKPTEIAAINGVIVEKGRMCGLDVSFNELLVLIISSFSP